MVGALLNYVARSGEQPFQPMKANYGILPALEPHVRNKRQRYVALSERALGDMRAWIEREGILHDVR